ncbi:MAG TPA: enoyl-CoA hydratase [Pseudomonadales bacterium]|mgnify:CR=1 FL=1|jgi:enoyl-CoA hydratase|nr:enoyl-CoA hydratase [Pseudomonadales bacterium]MDP6315520.1 enoyl-CoA hydratase [Pseudomonadales bacterium]MDP7315023.1 enoyl-CoA hydratase [Pseudomonadales bacterium]MDP7576774.1 enoyl-CoA hydratase [Pseudomonadales bacterium]HJL61284.1 enoyl-CoA hydratase [Pseudomonadales bacterium]|tara:strand:+ start:3784 stop:4569 length:786 start_codon:yes stop_codon:yes gene_type:complete
MSKPVLIVEKGDGIATLTLNRPDQMNALSVELRSAFAEEILSIRTDQDIRVVILTGAGRAFCAGLDLKEMGDPELQRAGSGIPDPASLLRSLSQPVIGAINGLAITGGFEISLSCDLLIVTPETQFADTHARVGLLAGWGLSQRLSRAVGLNRAKELSLTGNYLSAERAYEWGLVNRIVPREELLPACRALAEDMLSCVPDVMLSYKRLIDKGFDLALGDAMHYEVDINRMFQGPVAEKVAERRAGVQTRGREQAKSNFSE